MKITVFDVAYDVLCINSGKVDSEEEEKVIGVVDQCPYTSAALGEGHVTSCGRCFQCAHHGWSFDGKNGNCVEIPQMDMQMLPQFQQWFLRAWFGYFQAAGFELYSASKNAPQQLTEEWTDDEKGWIITSRVDDIKNFRKSIK
eukprot:1395471-Ditylum_brightwellii.AAC.1